MLREVEDNNFEVESSGVTIVDVWAPWCGNCKMMMPFVEKMAEELEGQAKVYKINAQEYDGFATKYGVMALPTLIIFKDGAEVQRLVGPRPYLKMLNEVKSFL